MQKKKRKKGPPIGVKLTEIKRTAIGQKMFSLRRAKGISQYELGKKTGLSLRAISYYERQSEGIPAPLLARIAKVLNVTTNYLLGDLPHELTDDEMPFSLRKAVETFKRLPKTDQKNVMNMIKALEAKNKLQQQENMQVSSSTN